VEISAVVLASTQMIHAAAVIIREWAKLDASREFSVEKQKDGTIVFKGRGGAGVEAVRDALLAHLESKVLGTTPHELASADAESADDVR
jgi:hypothetical protein